MLPIQLLDELNSIWQGYDFNLRTLLDNYRVDNPQLSLLIEELTTVDCQHGLFLRDTSGLAAHLLGLQVFDAWQRGKIFQKYKQVLWLPLSKILKLPIQLTNDRKENLNQLGRLINDQFEFIEDETLVVITGIDYRLDGDFQKQDFITNLTQWLEHIQNLPRLAIGNYVPDLLINHFNATISITLPPVFLNLRYMKKDSYEAPQHISFPGKLLVDEIYNHTRRTFRFNEDNPDGVFSINNTTVRNYMAGDIDSVLELEEKVEHLQPLLTIQDVVRILIGQPPPEFSKNGLSTLDTPAKWYYAALSAKTVHDKLTEKRKFFLYQISGHIIVRRMTDSSMHYITDLGPAENYIVESIKAENKHTKDEIQFILKCLINRNDFEHLDSASIFKALDEAKMAWINQATEARNSACITEGKATPKAPEKLSGESFKIFQSIQNVFRGNLTDNELTKGVGSLPKEEQDASYQTIQRHINNYFNAGHTSAEICEQITNILYNQPVDEQFRILIIMLAASFLAEAARYNRVFFAPFAILSLTLINKASWRYVAALPQRAQMNIHTASWQELILADCMDALGGVLPMAHNGSFIQTNPAVHQHAIESNYGISWPELKTQLLYTKWLNEIIKLNGISIKLLSSYISFLYQPTYYLLKENDQPLIMRDLELLLRVELSYRSMPGDHDILVKTNKPFERAMHLIADPRQLKIVSCGRNGEFGYFLCVPKQVDQKVENHFIHLTPGQAYMIALKFDAVGNYSQALKLYNYLCEQHPQYVAFRFSRVQCLVLHPELMKDDKLRANAQCDLDFLERKDQNFPLAFQEQIGYVSAVYSLRVTVEDKRFQSTFASIAFNVFMSGADKGISALKKFKTHDEEASMLQLLIAVAYRRAYESCHGIVEDVFKAMAAQDSCLKHITYYALTLFHTENNNINILKDSYQLLINSENLISHTMVTGLAQKTNSQSTWEQHRTISKKDTPSELILLENILRSWVSSFRKDMEKQKEFFKNSRERLVKKLPRNLGKYKTSIEVGFQEALSEEIETKRIIKGQTHALLIKINWQVNISMIEAWCEFHHFQSEKTTDTVLGPCLRIDLNSNYCKRSFYQPTPHPYSFLFETYQFSLPIEGDVYFFALRSMFRECLLQIKTWSMSTEKRVSYRVFGNQTLLPVLHLIKNNNQQDAVIELPNGVPIKIILNWLKKNNFSFYWINDTNKGRCLYLPQINIFAGNDCYNAAVSNGDIISPFIASLIEDGISVEIFETHSSAANEGYLSGFFYEHQDSSAQDSHHTRFKEFQENKEVIERIAKIGIGKSLADMTYDEQIQLATALSLREGDQNFDLENNRFCVELKLRCKNVKGDGFCFFRAIARQITDRHLNSQRPSLFTQLPTTIEEILARVALYFHENDRQLMEQVFPPPRQEEFGTGDQSEALYQKSLVEYNNPDNYSKRLQQFRDGFYEYINLGRYDAPGELVNAADWLPQVISNILQIDIDIYDGQRPGAGFRSNNGYQQRIGLGRVNNNHYISLDGDLESAWRIEQQAVARAETSIDQLHSNLLQGKTIRISSQFTRFFQDQQSIQSQFSLLTPEIKLRWFIQSRKIGQYLLDNLCEKSMVKIFTDLDNMEELLRNEIINSFFPHELKELWHIIEKIDNYANLKISIWNAQEKSMHLTISK